MTKWSVKMQWMHVQTKLVQPPHHCIFSFSWHRTGLADWMRRQGWGDQMFDRVFCCLRVRSVGGGGVRQNIIFLIFLVPYLHFVVINIDTWFVQRESKNEHFLFHRINFKRIFMKLGKWNRIDSRILQIFENECSKTLIKI